MRWRLSTFLCLLATVCFGSKHAVPGAKEYHHFLERTYVSPYKDKCGRGVRVGYFDVAVNIEFEKPVQGDSENVGVNRPLPNRKIETTYEFSFHNFWVVRYLKLCNRAFYEVVIDEDIVSQGFLCDAIPESAQSGLVVRNEGWVEMDYGMHTFRTVPFMYLGVRGNTSNATEASSAALFPSRRWLGHLRSRWVWHGWEFYGAGQHEGAREHYNVNPLELYNLATVQRDLGWELESLETLRAAKQFASEQNGYRRGLAEIYTKDRRWTYDKEPMKDPHFFLTKHVARMRTGPCAKNPNEKYLQLPSLDGALSQQMETVVEGLAIAYILGRTLVLPVFSLSSAPAHGAGNEQVLQFASLFDTSFLHQKLRGVVCHVAPNAPSMKDISGEDILSVPYGADAPLGWYRRQFGPLSGTVFAEKKVLRLAHPAGLRQSLVRFLGPHALHMECVLRDALRFHPRLYTSGMNLAGKMRAEGGGDGKYTAVDQSRDFRGGCVSMERLHLFRAEFCVSAKSVQERVDRVEELKSIEMVYLYDSDVYTKESRADELKDVWETGNSHRVRSLLDFLVPGDLGNDVPELIQGALNFIVCESADKFVGNGYSKFSKEVTRRRAQKGRASYVYNVAWNRSGVASGGELDKNTAAKLRTDKGRLLEPFLSTMPPVSGKKQQGRTGTGLTDLQSL
jgi:hypothetical protein